LINFSFPDHPTHTKDESIMESLTSARAAASSAVSAIPNCGMFNSVKVPKNDLYPRPNPMHQN
jgi:hypothetical protein